MLTVPRGDVGLDRNSLGKAPSTSSEKFEIGSGVGLSNLMDARFWTTGVSDRPFEGDGEARSLLLRSALRWRLAISGDCIVRGLRSDNDADGLGGRRGRSYSGTGLADEELLAG